MKLNRRGLLFWLPRLLALLFTLFLSIFALDVFDAGYSFGELLLALFMHLLPVMLLLVGLAFAWRWPWVGVLLYGSFGIWYLANNWYPAAIYANATIAGPPLIVALLFLLNWLDTRQPRHKLLES